MSSLEKVLEQLFQRTGKLSLPNKQLQVWLLIILAVITRLPFIRLGYGYDPDAWSVAEAGRYWRITLEYIFSRPPGYPLLEGMMVFIPPGAWWLSNIITVFVGALIVLLFYRLSKFELLQRPFWVAFLFLVTPVFWITSSETMDYVYALVWILGSYHGLLARRPWLSAVLLGIACGFRPVSGIFIVPSIIMLMLERSSSKTVILYILVFGLSGVLAFSPVLLTYGLDFIPGFELRFWPLQIGYRAVQVFGVVGTIVVGAVALVAMLNQRLSISSRWMTRPKFAYAISAITMVFILFIRVPDESAYLLPAVPFILILLDRLVGSLRWVAPLLVASVLLSAIISPQFWMLNAVDGMKWTRQLVVQPGTVVQDWQDRKRQISFAYAVLEADIPCGSLVISGWSLPSIRYLKNLNNAAKSCPLGQSIQYVHLLTRDEIVKATRSGTKVFWVGRASRYSEYIQGFRLMEVLEATYLDVGIDP